MIFSSKVLRVLVREGVSEAEYQMGLHYCVQNDGGRAIYWLKRAAGKNHLVAVEVMLEMVDKGLIIL